MHPDAPAARLAVFARIARPPPSRKEFRGLFARLAYSHVKPVIGLLLAAVFAWTPPLSADSGIPDPIRLRGVTYPGDLPTHFAAERGLFAQQGLNVDVRTDRSGKQNLQTLRAGATDFALMALTPFVLDRLAHPGPERPEDPVIITNLVHSTSLHRVVALADGDVRTPADLRDRRIGLMRGTSAEFLWWQFALYNRLAPDSAELVDLPIADLPAALEAGRIDAAVLWAPWMARTEDRGVALRALADGHIHSSRWVLVTTRRTAREHADACRALLAAYRRAIDFIERNPREALGHFAEHAGVAQESVQEREGFRSDKVIYGLGLDWSLIGSLQQQIEWAVRGGHVNLDAEPSLLSWIEPGPLRSLSPALVGLPRAAGEAPRP